MNEGRDDRDGRPALPQKPTVVSFKVSMFDVIHGDASIVYRQLDEDGPRVYLDRRSSQTGIQRKVQALCISLVFLNNCLCSCKKRLPQARTALMTLLFDSAT